MATLYVDHRAKKKGNGSYLKPLQQLTQGFNAFGVSMNDAADAMSFAVGSIRGFLLEEKRKRHREKCVLIAKVLAKQQKPFIHNLLYSYFKRLNI